MFELDYDKKAKEMQDFIAKTVADAEFDDVILAVSGGVDSAVSLSLAVRALGKEHVYAVLLPYGELSSTSLLHGEAVVGSVGLSKDHVFVRDIKSAVDAILNESEGSHSKNKGDSGPASQRGEQARMALQERDSSQAQNDSSLIEIRKGNMMARVRMIYLFDLAKQLKALVVGTENKSEHYLGYFTRFGDEASDIEPIRALYKTQVWEMAKHLGVPKEIIEKAPSAGLWEEQTDEKEFGFSYADADAVLYHYFEEKLPREGIIALGLSEKLVDSVLRFAQKNDFKHHVPHVFE